MYIRKCPKCKTKIEYELKYNRDSAEKLGRSCKKCFYKTRDQSGEKNPFFGKTHSTETKKKIASGDKSYWKDPTYKLNASIRTQGQNNPMYGKCNYNIWVEKYGIDEANRRNELYKKKQSILNSGEKNNMYGKPSPHGSGNGWSGWYKGWYFRSLKELSYLINVIEKNGYKWVSAESKKLQIPYVDWKGASRTYRADFLVNEKYLIEVKPSRLESSVSVKIKQNAAIEFCKSRGLEYKLEDVTTLSPDTIKTLYVNGEIKFMKTYEKLFRERYMNE